MVRERAHVIFAEPNLVKRALHAKRASCFASRSEVERVFSIETVDDCLETALAGGSGQRAIDVFFTEVTAVDRVCGIARIFNFARFDSDVREANLLQQF